MIYTLKELSEDGDRRLALMATKLLKDGFPETACFEIVLRQVIV